MPDLGMSSLGSFLQMLKCNWNFVSNRQKFSSHLVEVYNRSCRCIAMSNNTSSRVPLVVVWWRCWCLVRYGLLPCHSVSKWREKSSFFDILGEPLLGFTRVIMGSKTTIWVLYFCLKNSANYWVKHRIFLPKKKWVKMRGTIFFSTPDLFILFSLSISNADNN